MLPRYHCFSDSATTTTSMITNYYCLQIGGAYVPKKIRGSKCPRMGGSRCPKIRGSKCPKSKCTSTTKWSPSDSDRHTDGHVKVEQYSAEAESAICPPK